MPEGHADQVDIGVSLDQIVVAHDERIAQAFHPGGFFNQGVEAQDIIFQQGNGRVVGKVVEADHAKTHGLIIKAVALFFQNQKAEGKHRQYDNECHGHGQLHPHRYARARQAVEIGAILVGQQFADIVRQGIDVDLEFTFNGSNDVGFGGISQIDDDASKTDCFALLNQRGPLGFQGHLELILGDDVVALERFPDKKVVPRNVAFTKRGTQSLQKFLDTFKRIHI